MRAICKAIIDGGAEVAGLSGTSLPGNLNMCLNYGIEPTQDEAAAILRANEEYTKVIRGIVHGWVARLPTEERVDRRKITPTGEPLKSSNNI